MSAYAILHDRCVPIWEQSRNHPMVRAVADGTLAREVFRYYFEQNILYLEEYSRAIAFVLASAPDAAAMDLLGQFLRGEAENELPMNYEFLTRLGGDPAKVDPFAVNSANYSYSRHIVHTAATGDCAEGLAAILPCPCSYNEFARTMVLDMPDDPIYAEWIRRFGADPENDELLASLTGLFDRLVDVSDARRMRRLEWIFSVSSRYEVAFWEMAYTRGSGDIFS
jgi:thiaminase (transcriptional activator TenA)